MARDDPDFAIRDLYNAIAEGNSPSYTMFIQVMTFQEAENWKFNPFDLTKVWPHDEFPLIQVGKLVLNKNPKNYFAEVEQLAFSPAHLVPGIEASPDKMLQGRLFSYSDTHRHRLGANYLQIPVNCPYRYDIGLRKSRKSREILTARFASNQLFGKMLLSKCIKMKCAKDTYQAIILVTKVIRSPSVE